MWQYVLLFGIAVAVVAGWLFLQHAADRKRAHGFDTRDALRFDEWYGRYYAKTFPADDKSFVKEVLDDFGEAFGVIPTRLRPADRIEQELRLPGKLGLDDAWETLDALLARPLGKSVEWSPHWSTVDDIIRGLVSQRTKKAESR